MTLPGSPCYYRPCLLNDFGTTLPRVCEGKGTDHTVRCHEEAWCDRWPSAPLQAHCFLSYLTGSVSDTSCNISCHSKNFQVGQILGENNFSDKSSLSCFSGKPGGAHLTWFTRTLWTTLWTSRTTSRLLTRLSSNHFGCQASRFCCSEQHIPTTFC